MKHLLLAILVLVSVPAIAKRYIALFPQNEINISTLELPEYQKLLVTSNDKDVTQLKDWLGTRSRDSLGTVQSLWLVRGASLELDEATAKKLEKEPWVHRVMESQVRKFVHPRSELVVKNTLKELEGEEAPWGLDKIQLEKIRAEFPHLDGSGVRVGILDTGIQSKHPELYSNGRAATDKFQDFVVGLKLPYDDHGHGTHVAGTIAGTQVGIAPKSSLIVAKVFTAAGSGDDASLLGAMQWIVDPDGNPETADNAQLVSNSWGADLPGEQAWDIGMFEAYRRALQTWLSAGIVPIFAAGNSGSTPNGMPGGLPEAIAVGAIDSENAVAEFSSRGPNIWNMGNFVTTLFKPDISAPGVAVTSSFPGNKYATWDGTSMATPHVSGAVALLLQANHKLTPVDVKTLLLASSERKADVGYGYGILDAYRLIKLGTTYKK